MTDKLKCPFCGVELSSDSEYLHSEHFHCENPECILPSGVELHSSVWHKIIDGKKAQDAIQRIKDVVHTALKREFNNELRDDVLYISRIITSTTQQDTKE